MGKSYDYQHTDQLMSDMSKPSLKLLLATPRGFCAGVDRAVLIVERALEIYGPPVYVRHEIVHNKRVVDDLADKGAVFIEELSNLPDDLNEKTPVIFSSLPFYFHFPGSESGMLSASIPCFSGVLVSSESNLEDFPSGPLLKSK